MPHPVRCGDQDFRRHRPHVHPGRNANSRQAETRSETVEAKGERAMSDVSLQIDGKEVAATDDMSVLDAAKSAGIPIPTVCHHEKLKPFGGCRLCTVEAQAGGRTRSEEHTSELQSRLHLVCRLLLEKKK